MIFRVKITEPVLYEDVEFDEDDPILKESLKDQIKHAIDIARERYVDNLRSGDFNDDSGVIFELHELRSDDRHLPGWQHV